MKPMSQIRPLLKRGMLLFTAGTLALAGSAFGQNAAQPENSYPTLFITGFFGAQWYQLYQGVNARSHSFNRGVTWGERWTEDVSRYWGLEQSLTLGYNRLNIPVAGNRQFSTDTVNTALTANVLMYFTPRGSRLRPFVTFGPGYMWYSPRGTSTASPGVVQTVGLQRKGEPMFNYGLGLRSVINKRFGFTYEVRGTHSGSPKFGLPAGPVAGPNTLYLPLGGAENSIYYSVGLNYNLRYHDGYIPPPPVRDFDLTAAAPQMGARSASIGGNKDLVCRGDDVRLQATANGFGASPAYQWLVNGQPAAGGTGTAFSAPTTAPGSSAITVRVTGGDAGTSSASINEAVRAGDRLHARGVPANATTQWMLNGQPISGATASDYTASGAANPNAYSVQVSVPAAGALTSNPVTVNVLPVQPPTVQFAVSPSTVPYGTRIPLTATGRAVNNCNGNVTVSFSGEAVSGTNFDSTGISGLDMTNRLKAQSKRVILTATARDARGQTANATAPVDVTLGTEARRLDDIVFKSMDARVNNCGKRLLLETLAPLVKADPGGTVILIGHRDERERGARGAKLDEARVVNAAAILSGNKTEKGQTICEAFDTSRFKVKFAGAEQASQTRPSLCGSSVTERSGADVKSTDDRAQFRRVEVYFVPSGAAMPAGITGLVDAPAASIKKVGCPK